MQQRFVCLCFFCVHALLVLWVATEDVVAMIGKGYTLLPKRAESRAAADQPSVAPAVTRDAGFVAGARRLLSAYLHASGIEAGYSYFAPNVSPGYKLVFELHDAAGALLYETPGSGSAESSLRVAALLEQISHTPSDVIRETTIKVLARAASDRHPQVRQGRAVLSVLKFPTPDELRRGVTPFYRPIYVYDFDMSATPQEEPAPR